MSNVSLGTGDPISSMRRWVRLLGRIACVAGHYSDRHRGLLRGHSNPKLRKGSRYGLGLTP